jgi:hypothetical protein
MEIHAHAHAEHHKTGHRFLDLTLGISALVLSVISILLAPSGGRRGHDAAPSQQLTNQFRPGTTGKLKVFTLLSSGLP